MTVEEHFARCDELSTLPLRVFTPPTWAESALTDREFLLIDHAHLERKAAQNALSLLHRWPEHLAPETWVRNLSEIARDESSHLRLVLRLLNKADISFERHHRNDYAQGLREHIRFGEADRELLDRLIVSALIEARSCERFHLLAAALPDDELGKLYRGLWSSEKDHYLQFLELSQLVVGAQEVAARWDLFLNFEAQVIQRQPAGPRIHSWVGAE
ncbi:MAG: hypothetical protein KDD64_13555 [Bdellovibrionales bacterium]|nr:hypothetical protein [Bdellovibrionales bacterium]